MDNGFKDARLERLPAILQRTGLAKSTIYAAIARDEFPAPVHLGARASAWVAHEVDQWIASKAAHRDAHLDTGPGSNAA